MTGSDREPARYQEDGSIRSARSPRTAALAVVAITLLLVGIPFAYRLGAERQPTPQAPRPSAPVVARTAAPALDSPSPAATSPATGPSPVDHALERIGVIDIFGLPSERDCGVETIPKRSERSVRLGGQIDARDHGGWVFTCEHENGDRTRYFELASGITDALGRIGTTFVGGTSYVGEPGGTIETRWQVRANVMSGEIELLTVSTTPGTLMMVVLVDLRGSWQGSRPGS